MELKFQRPFLSIQSLESAQLPQFSILTGVNGSGKSHLLRALAEGAVQADAIDSKKIVLFNFENFRLENEGRMSADQAFQERLAAWNFFSTDTNYHIQRTLGQLRQNLEAVAERITSIVKAKVAPIWSLTRSDLDETDYAALEAYKTQVENHLLQDRLRGNQQALAILSLARKHGGFIDVLTEFEFMRAYEPYILRDNFLPNQLTRAFTDYYSKLEDNQYLQYRNANYREKNIVLSDDEFKQTYGPRPWILINEILGRIGSLPYRINSPEALKRTDIYQAELYHLERADVHPQFSDLSSGEKILMALVASVYKAQTDKQFPELLLLDEIDASLHPSMMQDLLFVIDEVFLNFGVNVPLVTHSPTTIALAPPESIFVMNKDAQKRIESRQKNDALEILTEGFATLEKGIHILDEVARTKISVLTEGRNLTYIESALRYAGITGVEVISGVEDRSGKNQLKTLFEFFSRLDHSSKLLIVWDCDAESYQTLTEVNNTIPFVFNRNPANSLAKNGIENLFPEELFEGFVTTVSRPRGRENREFDRGEKAAFEAFVLSRNEPHDFVNFEPLVEKIRGLLQQ